MVPRQSKLGGSFRGAGAYYLHDREADTSERVAFTHSENIPTQDPEKALKWMAWTAIHAEELKREAGVPVTGQACKKPVFTFSLSWHPEQDPQKWEMVGAGRRALIALGLEEHETLFVGHSDGVPHVHVIVNTIHPETGCVNTLSFSKLKLSKWAEEYEREQGKIYCEQRVENNERREQGEFIQYQEPELDFKAHITQLYHASDSGKAFQEALAQAGYKLAQGKRIVVIDGEGKLHSLSRQIEGVKAKDIRAKLGDIVLPEIDDARGQAGNPAETKSQNEAPEEKSPEQTVEPQNGREREEAKPHTEYFDRDVQDRAWQESIIDASLEAEEARPSQPKPKCPPKPTSPQILNALQDRRLAELGQFYDEIHHARLKLATELEQYYAQDERELRREADGLAQVLSNSGRLRKFWLKLTRQIPKTAEEDLKNMRLTLENSEWRQNEARQALEADIARRRQEIEDRHKQEQEDLRYGERLDAHEGLGQSVDEFSEDPDLDEDCDEDFGPTFEY